MRIDVKGVIGQLEILFQRITQELDLFKDEQRFVSLGRTPTRNLQTIDKWFEGVSNCVEILRQTLVNFTTNLCAVLRPDLQSDIQADSMQVSLAIKYANYIALLRLMLRLRPVLN